MPALANVMHERFCQQLHSMPVAIASRAYIAAGYTAREGNSAEACASTLLSTPKVKQRMSELAAESAKKSIAAKVDILARLLRVAEMAEGDGQLSSAVRAYELIGKEQGLFIERRDVTNRDAPSAMGAPELGAALLASAGALGLSPAALDELRASLVGIDQVPQHVPKGDILG